jgi:insulysin
MIIKPKNEKRIINYHIFSNNVKVILISDEELDKSYIVSGINVGSYQNKDYYDGMAHLLEHMCFIGSKNFPEKNYLINKAQEFGGFTNAYTSLHETVYYVEVLNKYINEIFEILVDCLINSKLNQDDIYSELQNVDSEHMKNINDDGWKIYNMFHFLGNKKSNYNNFSTGSLKTLNKKDLYIKMLDFYKKYYHANNFTFCIASNLKSDDLLKLAKKYIEIIPPSSVTNDFKLIKPLYSKKCKAYFIESIDKRNEIIYIFETEYNSFYYYLAYIIGNQHEDLLVDKLKNLGYIINLSAEYDQDGIFKIFVNLTDLKYIKKVDSYLKSFINCTYQLNWKEIYKYYLDIQHFNFNNQGKMNTLDLALALIENLRFLESINIPISKIYPRYPYIEKITLDKLNFNNCIQLIFSNKKMENINLIEPNYQTKYKQIKFINEPIINCKFIFNFKNNYLKEINVKKLNETLINKNKRIWFGQTSKFNESNVSLNVLFYNANMFNSPKNIILTKIFISLFNNELEKKLSTFFELGYNINLSSDDSKELCVLHFSMYNNEKINKKIIEDVFNIMLNDIHVSDIFIKNIIDYYYYIYYNIKNSNPYDYSEFIFTSQFTNGFTLDNFISEINKIKKIPIKSILEDIKTMILNSAVVIFNLGNTKEMIELPYLKKNLKLPLPKLPKINFKKEIIIKHNQKNKCIKISYFIGKFNPNIVLHLIFIIQIFEPLFFQTLRTEKKLGYLTKMEYSSINDNYYLFQKIQTTVNLDKVLQIIQEFNNTLISKLKDIDLDSIKKNIHDILSIEPNNTHELSMKYYSEIISRQYIFNRNKLLIKEINKITKDSLIKFIKKYIFNNKFINTIQII